MATRSPDHGVWTLLTRPIVAWVARGVVALLLVGFGLTLEGRPALAAATLFVTSTADSGPGTLRDAIAAASPGDVIEFSFPGGTPGCPGAACTITLTSGELVIDKPLSIVGPGASSLTIMRSAANGTAKFRIFRILRTVQATIHGVTITNGSTGPVQPEGGIGRAGGGGIFSQGGLVLSDSKITGNRTEASGGGIHQSMRLHPHDDWERLTIINSEISGNTAGQSAEVFSV